MVCGCPSVFLRQPACNLCDVECRLCGCCLPLPVSPLYAASISAAYVVVAYPLLTGSKEKQISMQPCLLVLDFFPSQFSISYSIFRYKTDLTLLGQLEDLTLASDRKLKCLMELLAKQ